LRRKERREGKTIVVDVCWETQGETGETGGRVCISIVQMSVVRQTWREWGARTRNKSRPRSPPTPIAFGVGGEKAVRRSIRRSVA